jgi:putative ABC transport system permease protein
VTERPLPRVAVWLLTRRVPPEWRESIIGDLEEERRRRRALGSSAGPVWATGAAWRIAHALQRERRTSALHVPSQPLRFDMSGLTGDLRHATRALFRNPGYAVAAIATLALGIGANTAVFNLANWLLLRPLPGVADSARLISIRFGSQDTTNNTSVPHVNALSAGVPALSGLTAYQRSQVNVTPVGSGSPRRLVAEFVTANFFDVLRESFTFGRGFTTEEGDPGADGTAVISHRFWQDDLGGDAGVIGRTILVSGERLTVVGVTARGFHGVSRSSATDVWLPVGQHRRILPMYPATLLSNPKAGFFHALIGRLRDGAAWPAVASQADAVLASLQAADPKDARLARWRFVVGPGTEPDPFARNRLTGSMSLLMGIVSLLLLLTCANVTNLVLGRASGRRTEIATRLALGASRLRVARLLLVESAVLALAASGVALGVTWLSARLLQGTIVLQGLRPLDRAEMDWRVVGFALLASVFAAVAAGVGPAFSSSRGNLQPALRDNDRSQTGSRGLLRRVLIVAQVGVSLALLLGALLLARSMAMRNAIDPGFDPARVLAFSVDPQLPGFDDARQAVFYRELLDRVRALPGVRAAGVSSSQPFAPIGNEVEYWPEGRPAAKVDAEFNLASAGFFGALGLPFAEGRDFSEDELLKPAEREGPVIINESAARQMFGHEPATGRRIVLSSGRVRTIVGVVRDMRQRQLLKQPEPMLFVPWRYALRVTVYVGLAAPPEAVAAELRKAIAAVEPRLPIYDLTTLRGAINRQLADDILITRLSLVFASLATVLTALGLYSVLARAVAERRREFSIRTALGARPSQVARVVTGDALRLVAIGTVSGLGAAFWLSRFVQSRLFGVTSLDPLAIAGAVALIVIVTILSAIVPARRAARIDAAAELR